MATWVKWEKALHQAAIVGKVIDPRTSLPAAGASVTITSMPPAFTKWLLLQALSHNGRWGSPAACTDRTVTAEDGIFRFVDLPDGAYTVEIAPKEVGRRFGKIAQNFTVERDADGKINATIALIHLPATALRGTILGSNTNTEEGTTTAPLPMARVEVLDTIERAYCDASGEFYVSDIEPGVRQIEVTASGYKATITTVTIVKGEITELGSFVLDTLSVTG